ncbi:FimV/HubP family polar landmark protein [Pseudomonas nunensis]|uniref:FimV/HubP family polar landmark protein n=1 Tax=Pseudomonas nunensis TaxID=2961896 RepID=UPI0025AF84E6|nr:FimV/HubP family polar landmark protein [Pseudomonas nunensis]MDN3222527.1 FimV/HubP family polar landmark protein [Pseudomonas nunensis]
MLESWHVVLRYCTQLLLVGGAVTYSALAPALGLGDITVHSALNQPFSADIALVDATGLAESDLSVSLATADEFSRSGVERVFFLNNLKFSPILRGNRTLIRVTSSKPVNEPFLNFLVQLNQPNGRLLREYTVLIDPPGSPGIVPATDEPSAKEPTSGFPSVEPTPAPKAAAKSKVPAPAASVAPPAAPANDEVAEQLAASVLQNQQLQKTIDELNVRIKTQDEQIADERKQVSDLQTRLAEVAQKPAAAPVPAVAPAPVVVEEPESSNWLLIAGVLALVLLVVLGLFVRRQRQQALTEPLSTAPLHDEPEREIPPHAARVAAPLPDHREETPAGDVLEGVGIYMAYGRFSEAAGLLREALAKEPQRTDLALHLLEVLGKQGDTSAYDAQESSLLDAGVDPQQLADLRARFPKLASVAPAAPIAPIAPVIATVAAVVPEAASGDDFHLNLDDLSMDSNWDLVSPFEDSPSPTAKPPVPEEPAFTSNLHVMPDVFEMPDEPALGEPELEWDAEPEAQSLDDDFLDAFNEPGQSLELEPLPELVPAGAGKLEQAQTCIDDGDLDSAIELLNELLKEGDEPLKQTARTLLAGIR